MCWRQTCTNRLSASKNFEMGAVVSLVLLLPAVAAFIADRWVQRKQIALLSARAVPFQPKSEPLRDWLLFGFCTIIAFIFLAMLGMADLRFFRHILAVQSHAFTQ